MLIYWFNLQSRSISCNDDGPRLAGPKLWNAINTDVRGKLSLYAFITAYKNLLLSLYH